MPNLGGGGQGWGGGVTKTKSTPQIGYRLPNSVKFCTSLQMEGGRISLEGTVCEDYYKIRQLLYTQFAII